MPDDRAPRPALRLAEQRPVDELANLITHGFGFLLSLLASVGLMRLVVDDHRTGTIVACGVYSVSLVGLYAASMLSHLFHDPAWRRFFRMLDQAFIYLLIAGSFTPFAVTYLWQDGWPALLVVMWVLAVFGVLLVLRMRDLTPMAKITYGMLGWLPIIALKPLFENVPAEPFAWILAGGLFYSTGAVFLRFDQQVRYFHALWHTFVIAGSTAHYIAILLVMR